MKQRKQCVLARKKEGINYPRIIKTIPHLINRKKDELFNHVSTRQYLINRKRRNYFTTYLQDNILLSEQSKIFYLKNKLALFIVEAGVGDHGLLELVLEVAHLLPELAHPAGPVLAAVRAAAPAVQAARVPPAALLVRSAANWVSCKTAAEREIN
jgi:hypothetical protein